MGNEIPNEYRTIPNLLETKADKHENKTFLQYADRAISYGALDRQTNAIAHGFLEIGVRPGDQVCLYLYNSLEYLYTYLALSKIGAVTVPIDTRFSGEALGHILSETTADTILIDARTKADYEAVRSHSSYDENEFFIGDQDLGDRYRAFDELLSGHSTPPSTAEVDETDTLSIIFNQRRGSERPRGVLLPHYSYLNTGWEAGRQLFEFTTDDRVFINLPLYSIFTFQVGVMAPLLADAKLVLADRFDPDTFWSEINNVEATVFLYLSRMLSVLYNQDSDSTANTNTVEKAIGHGWGFDNDEEIISGFEERFDISVFEGYGVTQSATLVTYNSPADRRIGSVGKPVSYVDIAIVDEDGWPVKQGDTGEIVVRPNRPNTMMQRYYRDAEGTVEDCRNQWIHTEDIGYLDGDGYLYFIANQDNSIYRGRIAGRISSLEVESVISSMPAVEETVVVGLTNDFGKDDIMAIVVPTEGAELSPMEICRYCEKNLPHLKVPRFIELCETLPRNSTGKVQKSKLRSEGPQNAWDREIGYDLNR